MANINPLGCFSNCLTTKKELNFPWTIKIRDHSGQQRYYSHMIENEILHLINTLSSIIFLKYTWTINGGMQCTHKFSHYLFFVFGQFHISTQSTEITKKNISFLLSTFFGILFVFCVCLGGGFFSSCFCFPYIQRVRFRNSLFRTSIVWFFFVCIVQILLTDIEKH